mgnify:CR=1 FL=1
MGAGEPVDLGRGPRGLGDAQALGKDGEGCGAIAIVRRRFLFVPLFWLLLMCGRGCARRVWSGGDDEAVDPARALQKPPSRLRPHHKRGEPAQILSDGPNASEVIKTLLKKVI